jgi:hypothetical protein
MAKYTVLLSKRAQKQLDKLIDVVVKPILLAIEKLGIIRDHMALKSLKVETVIVFALVTIV